MSISPRAKSIPLDAIVAQVIAKRAVFEIGDYGYARDQALAGIGLYRVVGLTLSFTEQQQCAVHYLIVPDDARLATRRLVPWHQFFATRPECEAKAEPPSREDPLDRVIADAVRSARLRGIAAGILARKTGR